MQAKYIWMNGNLVPWDEAKIHVMSHVIHYGSGGFEGIRMYEREPQKKGVIFRLEDHMKRLLDTVKLYYMTPPYTLQETVEAVITTVKANALSSGYIRPLIYRGLGSLRITPYDCPVDMMVGAWSFGDYFKEDPKKGARFKVSSWNRPAPNTLPMLSKATGHYLNSQLIEMEAHRDGYTNAIALNVSGYVSEASILNVFVIKGGTLITTPITQSILSGITRHSILTIAKDKGIPIIERPISREELYLADELFCVGTLAEIIPVIELDGIRIHEGQRGPITSDFIQTYSDIIEGNLPDTHGWLTFVNYPS